MSSRRYGRAAWERIEEVEQRLGVGIGVHEDEPAPALGAHPPEPQPFGQVGELVRVHHLGEPAVERVAPRVVAALHEAVGEAPGTGGEPGAAVEAGVVEGADRPVVAPDDEDRLVPDLVLDEVARLGELLLAARDLPDPAPQPVQLEAGELGRRVASLGNEPSSWTSTSLRSLTGNVASAEANGRRRS